MKHVAGTLRVPSKENGKRSVPTTGLLVSVRSAAEAQVALAAGADLIDVKEPRRGSLGAADPAVWREVSRAVAGRVPVSVALGELIDHVQAAGATAGLPSSGVNFAKIGLARMGDECHWRSRWTDMLSNLPASVRPVAVAYADWQAANAPKPLEVLDAAAGLGPPYLLVDTFDKSHGRLLDHLSPGQLHDLSARAAGQQMRLVLAGSLDKGAIARLLPLRPAYIAVRGAACRGGRTQTIDAAHVKRLAALVRTSIDGSSN